METRAKKDQYAIRQSLSNFFNNSLKLDKRARQRWRQRNGYRCSYTKYVLNVTAARQSAVTGLKWFYSSFSAIRYGDNERPSTFPDRGPRDLSISIRCETTLPKRLHSRAVTCELNDHRIKFASTATATERGWEGRGVG